MGDDCFVSMWISNKRQRRGKCTSLIMHFYHQSRQHPFIHGVCMIVCSFVRWFAWSRLQKIFTLSSSSSSSSLVLLLLLSTPQTHRHFHRNETENKCNVNTRACVCVIQYSMQSDKKRDETRICTVNFTLLMFAMLMQSK